MKGWMAIVALLGQWLCLQAVAQTTEPQGALAQMPVKALTVFKDGHAYVLHEGEVPTNVQAYRETWCWTTCPRRFWARSGRIPPTCR